MSFRMPFGKHRGKPLLDVPTDYLRWLVENQICYSYSPHLAAAVEREYARRTGDGEKVRPEDATTVLTRDLINQWYRRLALVYHRDRGGSDELMGVVNHAKQLLEEMLT